MDTRIKLLAAGAAALLVIIAWSGYQQQKQITEKTERYILQLGSEDAEMRRRAAEELSRLGPPAEAAVPALLRALAENEDPNFPHFAANALGAIGPGAKEALPALRPLLSAPNPYVRVAAASALGRIAEAERAGAANFLLKALNDENHGVRANAASALGDFKEEAAQTLPALKAALSDPAEGVRVNAQSALRRLDTPEAQATLAEAGL